MEVGILMLIDGEVAFHSPIKSAKTFYERYVLESALAIPQTRKMKIYF